MVASRLAARVLLALLVVAGVSACAQDDNQDQDQVDELLPADQVFRYAATADAGQLYLDFDVLEGHYLYRTRFGFDSGTAGVAIGAARFPRGETHSDEFFGDQEIYRHKFRIAIPYRRTAAVESFDLKVELQGCADRGLCYLPQEWTATIALPPAPLLGGGAIDASPTADEVARLNARIAMLENQGVRTTEAAAAIRRKLDDAKFVANAPPDLVGKERARLEEFDDQLAKVEKSLEELKSWK